MGGLQLSRLLSDGMVVQHGRRIHIWGKDEPGSRIVLAFMGESYNTAVNEEGCFEFFLPASEPGGPYEMILKDDAGEEKVIRDVLVGDVFFCSGQSNMELPMARVKDRYPEEVAGCENDRIRTFKITECGDFHGPLEELGSGSWVCAAADTIMDFSATGYFFAAELYKMTGVPVGFINASLGGSRMESWLGREMIEDEIPYPQVEDRDLGKRSQEDYGQAKEAQRKEWLREADTYADDSFVAGQLEKNERQSRTWHDALDAGDLGLLQNWEREDVELCEWKQAVLPFFFKDTELKGFIGSVWFRRSFFVPAKYAGRPMHLWLGTIVDSDTVYVNGSPVGHTDYQYPPRKYEIPSGLLREGENSIVIRVKCENGYGRFTPGKKYAVWTDEYEIDLRGTWYYRIGASCGQIAETDFVNWKPTGLYNGMTAPCHAYTIGGIVWYQGEANTHKPDTYLDGMKAMIGGYRKKWNDESIPFYIVQLPNFLIDLLTEEDSWREDGVHILNPGMTESGWREIREKQRLAQAIPNTYMVVTMDLGEDNDLHPLNKKEIGRRLALLAAAGNYRKDIPCESPEVVSAEMTAGENGKGYRVGLLCEHTGGELHAFCEDKGTEITDFELADADGVCYPAKAVLEEAKILLTCEDMKEKPEEVRYCYRDTNSGALVYNAYGLPMSPFKISL